MGNPEFLVKGSKFLRSHPDFLEKLQDADRRKLDMDPAAREEIERLAAPEVLYWLSSDECSEGAHTLNNLVGKPEASRQWVREKAAQLKEQGYERVGPTDEYLNVRREARREGISFEEKAQAQQLSATDTYLLKRKMERRGRR